MSAATVLKSSRWLGYSLLGHVVVVGGLIYLSHRVIVATMDGGAGSPEMESVATMVEPGADSASNEIHVFDGISYSDFSQRLEKANAQSKASNLLGKLKGLKFDGANSAVGVGQDPGPAVAPEIALTKKRGETLTAMVDKQQLNIKDPVASKKAQTRKMTDQERGELRKKFRQLEAEFRKVYGRALNQDPHLSVTVAFEAEIQPDGFLTLSNFKARGTYRPESVALLKTEMTTLIAKVFVAKDLSGALVRGESIFVK